MLAPWPVLYEDNHLLVVNKPAMLPTMGVAVDRDSLLNQAREYIARKYHKPGNVYLGIVSRLDAPVTGVVVMARTSKAAARLTEQFRARTVQKNYWALVEGAICPSAGQLVDVLRKDERHRKMHVVRPEAEKLQSDAASSYQQARLTYRTLQEFADYSLAEVTLETGRKHQIRLQLSHAGHPILGDRKYGSGRPFSRGIALHARRLVVEHPTRKEPLELIAPPPAAWRKLLPREPA